jgi:hypothetical protein
MAEVKNIEFELKEVAEALVRYHDIHEGFWGISVRFGIQGINIATSPSSGDLTPAAIVPILNIGLQKFDDLNNLAVDASKVNPKKKKPKIKAKKKPN